MGDFLVTGGAGFVGSHLCDKLIAAGDTVTVLDNMSTGRRENLPDGVQLIEGDIRDGEIVKSAMQGKSGCFHLAAIASVDASNNDWAGTHRVNLTGTINVYEAARDAGQIPVVYASSAAVYGAASELPVSETTEKAPLSAYGADKLGCELHAVPAFLVHGVPSTALRLFNVYGPRQEPNSPYSGVISIFARMLKNNQAITIHGDGGQTRDFVYVEDVCEAFLRSMRTTQSGARSFNVCTGKQTSILELAEIIAELTGFEGEFLFGPKRRGDIFKSVGCGDKLSSEIDYAPSTSIRDGLFLTLNSFE